MHANLKAPTIFHKLTKKQIQWGWAAGLSKRMEGVWKSFHEGYFPHSGPLVACKGCLTTMKHPHSSSDKSTGNMTKHLGLCKKPLTPRPTSILSTLTDQRPPKKKQKAEPFTKDGLVKKLVKLGAMKNISLSGLESKEFKEILEYCRPDNGVKYTRHTLNKCLFEEAEHGIELLKERLLENDSLVSLSVDAWSSNHGHKAFLGTTPY